MARKKKKGSFPVGFVIVAVIVVLFTGIVVMNTPSFVSPSPLSISTNTIAFDFTSQHFVIDGNAPTSPKFTNKAVNLAENRAAAILVDSPGGSGTFYYLVGGMIENGKEVYSQPVSIGDRVKIESVTVENPGTENNGIITVEYLTRPENAPMSDEPTVLVTEKYAFEDDGNLIEILN